MSPKVQTGSLDRVLFTGSPNRNSKQDFVCSHEWTVVFLWGDCCFCVGHSQLYLSHHQDNAMMTSAHAVCSPSDNEPRAHLTPPDLEQLWGSKVKYKLTRQPFVLMHHQRVRVDPLYDLWWKEFKGVGVSWGRMVAYDVGFWCSKENCPEVIVQFPWRITELIWWKFWCWKSEHSRTWVFKNGFPSLFGVLPLLSLPHLICSRLMLLNFAWFCENKILCL